jgi:hypothetical protein
VVKAVWWGGCIVLALGLASCFRAGDDDPCDLDGDCADVDADDDPCTRAACSAGLCVVEPVFNALCQCFDDSDCDDEACAVASCTDHLCTSAPKPAGPLEALNDCEALACDGVSTEPVVVDRADSVAECGTAGDECRRDGECADTDDDPCTRPVCTGGVCGIEPVYNALCECFDDSDCDDRACALGTCTDHQCGYAPKPAGEFADNPGDCEARVCDGMSTEPVVVPDLDDAPEDTVADCRKPFCAESGGILFEPDGSDVPADEAGDCRFPVCDGMTTDVQYEPDGADLPADEAADCRTPRCDGVTPQVLYDPDDGDLPDDGNDCTSDTCSNAHVVHDTLANGTECAMGDGFCFRRACETSCQPEAAACGLEGSGEPGNDESGGAAGGAGCGMLDADDIDWYSFYANDGAFSHDVLHFTVWTSASTVELCAYVDCSDGTSPGGGCSTKLPGPSGSEGCCWTGSGGSLTPSWDLDCGTSEDSGTVYYSIRSTTAGECAQYATHGRY